MRIPPSLLEAARRRDARLQRPAGVPAAVQRDPACSATALVLTLRDGTAYESAERWGAAHLLERVAFRGTARFPSRYEVLRHLERFGGRVLAHPTRETASFQAKVPCGREAEALELLGELLLRPMLRPEAVGSERRAAAEERLRELEDPGRFVSALLEGALLLPEASARPPAADAEALSALDADALREWARGGWQRGALVAAVCGNPPADMESRLNEALSAFPEGPGRERSAVVSKPAWAGARALWCPSRGEGPVRLELGWRFPVRGERERACWEALDAMLGTGRTSLLNLILRERESVASSCATRLLLRGKDALFTVALALGERELPRVLPLIDGLLVELASRRVDAALFDEAVARRATDLLFTTEDPLETARSHAASLLERGVPAAFGERFAELERASFEGAAALVAEHLRPGARTVALMGGAKPPAAAFPGLVEVPRSPEGSVRWR
ncbi:MAG: insulinase family protein [Elusimicrobiota bacterium]